MNALAGELRSGLGRVRGVQANPDLGGEPILGAVLGQPALDGDSRGEGLFRRIEAHEEPVARGGDLLAQVRGENLAEGGVVPAQERLPGLIAQDLDEIGGAHDVGEHEGLEHAAGRTGLSAQLPGQEILHLLHHDRRCGTGGRCREEELVLDRLRTHHLSLAVLAGQPVEGTGRQGDAVPGTDAFVSVDPRSEHA